MADGWGELKQLTFRGHALDVTDTYEAHFLTDESGILDTHAAQAIETTRKGNFPLHAYAQPDGVRIVVEIVLLDTAQENYDQLKQWFDPSEAAGYLTGVDGNDVTRRIVCVPEKLSTAVVEGIPAVNVFKASLRAASGVWENAAATEDTQNISVTGQTFDVTNNGSARVRPTFTITPQAAKSSADDYTRRRRVAIASRTEVGAMDDPEGDGYPVELSNDIALAPGDDMRVIIKGREYDRWVSGDKLWANMQFQPRRRVTLAAAIDDVSTDDITVNELLAEEGWVLSNGFLLFEDTLEAVQFASLGLQSFGGIVRGAIGTTAASHLAGEAAYLVEHGAWVDIISTKDTPGSPPFPAEKKPVIDLDASSNEEHVWPGPFLNTADTSRSRAWQAVRSEDGLNSDHIRLYDATGNVMRFEDLLPTAGKALGNNAEMAFPVPVRAASGAVVATLKIENSFYLQALVQDLDGNETRLFDDFVEDASSFILNGSPGDELALVRLNARIAAIVGELTLTLGFVYFDEVEDSDFYIFHIEVSDLNDVTHSVVPDMHASFHFVLDEETSIDGFLAYFNGTSSASATIWSASGYSLDRQVGTVLWSGGSVGLRRSAPAVGALVLPAGEYWLVFQSGPQVAVLGTRTKGSLFFAILADPSEIPLDTNGQIVFVLNGTNVERLTVRHIEQQIEAENLINNYQAYTPLMAVLSKTAQPQTDAPTQTGYVVEVSSVDVLLDDTRTPLLWVSDEADFYLLQGTLSNNTTDQSCTLFYPMGVGESLTIDCENRRVIDGETGLDVPFAMSGEWPDLAPGVNELEYTEVGVGNLDIGWSFRDKFL